ncbi:uncharacterized protein LOC129615950 [Condylostylus longicornis]|uniref:uncharacterized protein LOC129615950 n=1 Tax=Condylostylus longicornis TaxID=2530218 RepID=UPI00244E4123|nr:uncharacterized protein LOC129615950 [Condylostylus longicornis]
MLKSSQKYICEQLTIITNKSLVEGIVPKDIKTGRIVPAFKTGVKNVLDNYRPICITPVLSKNGKNSTGSSVSKKSFLIHQIDDLESRRYLNIHSSAVLAKRCDVHSVNTRYKDLLHVNRKNTSQFGTSTSMYIAIKLYNELNDYLKQLDAYKLKKELINKTLQSYSLTP